MNLNKLTLSDKVIGGSVLALLVFSFLPWYGYSVKIAGFATVSGSRNGWDYFLFGIIPVLLAIAVAVVIYLQRFTAVKLPDLPIPWSQALLGASGLAALLVLLRLALTDKAGGVDLNRKFGLFLSVLAVIGLVAGSFMKMQEPESTPGL